MMKPAGSPGIGRRFLRLRVGDRHLGRVLRADLRDRDLWPERLYLAALAEAHALLGLDPAQVRESGDEPGGAVDLGAGVARRQILHVTDVVTVTVGDEDQINVAELGEVLVVGGCLGILREKGSRTITLPVGVVILNAA